LASALSSIIRQKVPNGYLPSIRPAEVFGGPGAGGQCVACNRELRVTQFVMDCRRSTDLSSSSTETASSSGTRNGRQCGRPSSD
jgi:hypothetical protein